MWWNVMLIYSHHILDIQGQPLYTQGGGDLPPPPPRNPLNHTAYLYSYSIYFQTQNTK